MAAFSESIAGLNGEVKRELFNNHSLFDRIPSYVDICGFLILAIILWGGILRRRVLYPPMKRLFLCMVVLSVL